MRNHRFGRSILSALIAALLAAPVVAALTDAAPASAATGIEVTTFTDGGPGSLRSAIQHANTDAADDKIQLSAGTYTLTLTGAGENAGATGDLDVLQPITLVGPYNGTTIIDASALGDRVLHILGNGNVRLERVTIVGGSVVGDGGAILVENGKTVNIGWSSLLKNNATGSGGALATNGSFGISNSTIARNIASGVGGGISFAMNSGLSNITNVTLNSNKALSGGAIAGTGTRLNIGQSTISGNTATTNSALLVQGNANAMTNVWKLEHITVASNKASSGGAVSHTGTGSIWLTDSIVAANTGGNCGSAANSLLGTNVVGDSSCGAASPALYNLQGADPGLSLLDDNGGASATRALIAGSPAINRSTCAADEFDQRNIRRPVGPCDSGAYERTVITNDDQISLDSQKSALISVMDNDIGKDETTFGGTHPGVTLSIVSGPSLGTAVFEGLSIRYTSAVGAFGVDLIDYRICVDTTCSTSTLSISIDANTANEFVAVPPTRILDTRGGGSKPGAGSTTLVNVTGVPGVPATGVIAVVLNVTATEATAPGFVTVWPAGSERPTASSLNIEFAGQTIPNLVTVTVGTLGQVALFTQTGTHFVADIAGYYRPADELSGSGRFTPVTPTRLLDTRTAMPVGAGTSVDVRVAGIEAVPAAASAVVLNVTATNAQAPGFVTVWPAGGARPTVSNLNIGARGQTIPNLVIVPVGTDGNVSLFSQSGTDLVVDITGWFTDQSAPPTAVGLFVPINPTRAFDTRETKPVGAGETFTTRVTDGGVLAVVLNVTATESAAPGFVTVWPPNVARPTASNLNLDRAGQTIANAVIVGADNGSTISFFSQTGTHLIADMSGFYISD